MIRRINERRASGISFLAAVALTGLPAVAGPRDSIIASNYIESGSIRLGDLNGDCYVSDVDAAIYMFDRLKALHGPGIFIADYDGDGQDTATDQVLQLADEIDKGFGKFVDHLDPVDVNDVATVIAGAAASDPQADVDGDMDADTADVAAVVAALGSSHSRQMSISVAWHLRDYVLHVADVGPEHFFIGGCVTSDHLEGVSSTWEPRDPRWWPDNHLASVSRAWNPWSQPGHGETTSQELNPRHTEVDSAQHREMTSRGHYESTSENATPDPTHNQSISQSWPASHSRAMSIGYPLQWKHDWFSSRWNVEPVHEQAVSRGWAPGHDYNVSSSWEADHEVVISRTYWPSHELVVSERREAPPPHTELISAGWRHDQASSRQTWPPGHDFVLSQTWGWNHHGATSAAWPPMHLSVASKDWRGPQPTWPPSHTRNESAQWGEPSSQPWPVFPPNHSWWTSFTQLTPLLPIPNPWGSVDED